ncbi:MAG: phenol hydroxylase subunit [Rhodoferax sp.]|nr:phenol hydroxylase subunit [Rhodoferax sp.]
MTMTMTFTSPTGPTCEIKQKFVRVRQVRPGGLVCFEFAIGWPELFVDLMLPQAAFDDFCVQNQVQVLND